MSIINKNNINKFAYNSLDLVKTTPRAIVIEFFGLGGGTRMMKEHHPLSYFYAERGVVFVMPYYGPWAWMNDGAVKIVDEVVEAICSHYGVENGSIPTLSTGLSMGGQGALIYALRSKYTPIGVSAVCPVCDLVYHSTEREDTLRTIYCAYPTDDFEGAMKKSSPLHQAENMPKIPYFLVATLEDNEVDYRMHANPFMQKMTELGHDVRYIAVPGRGHCDMSEESVIKYKEFIMEQVDKYGK